MHWGLRAIDLRPNDAEMIETLAAAYVEAGQPDKALETYEQAMKIGGSYWVRYYQGNLKKKGFNPARSTANTAKRPKSPSPSASKKAAAWA